MPFSCHATLDHAWRQASAPSPPIPSISSCKSEKKKKKTHQQTTEKYIVRVYIELPRGRVGEGGREGGGTAAQAQVPSLHSDPVFIGDLGSLLIDPTPSVFTDALSSGPGSGFLPQMQ